MEWSRTSSENVAPKKPAGGPDKCRPAASNEPCAKCGRINHTIAECHAGINKCRWCGSPDHSIATCPRRQKVVEKAVARLVPSPHQENLPLKPPMAGRAYIMSKKEATASGTVVTGTLFLNSKPFCVWFDSGATHSFISTQAALQLNLKQNKEWANSRISLPNGQAIECLILYKHVPIVIAEHEFPVDLT